MHTTDTRTGSRHAHPDCPGAWSRDARSRHGHLEMPHRTETLPPHGAPAAVVRAVALFEDA